MLNLVNIMKKSLTALIVIFFVNILSLYYGWYLDYSWSDQILHFWGGFFVASFFSAYLKDNLRSDTKIKNTLIITGAAAFIGVLWEFSEFLASSYLSPYIYHAYGIKTYFIGDLEDTLNDLLMDILGACFFVGTILHPLGRRKTHKV